MAKDQHDDQWHGRTETSKEAYNTNGYVQRDFCSQDTPDEKTSPQENGYQGREKMP